MEVALHGYNMRFQKYDESYINATYSELFKYLNYKYILLLYILGTLLLV